MQTLSQKICQKYGWASRFTKDPEELGGRWSCHVTVVIHDERTFTSQNTSPEDTEEGKKQGMAAAAQSAVAGLVEEVAKQEAKPHLELTQVFPPFNPKKQNIPESTALFVIRGSSPPNWSKYIWSNKPKVVGIDTEGNQHSSPPVLVQIATDDCVLLEITSLNGNQLSANLQRLLDDPEITKVFCDNYAHHDKRALGLLPPTEPSDSTNIHDDTTTDATTTNGANNNSATKVPGEVKSMDFTTPPIVDLEALSAKILGPVKTARGLSRIVSLSMPELEVVIGKPPGGTKGRFKTIGKFTLIDQGKAPPLLALRNLSRRDQHYAAVDAWATLQAYKRLAQVETDQKSGEDEAACCALSSCNKPGTIACSSCKQVHYCTPQHQEEHLELHKAICNNAPRHLVSGNGIQSAIDQANPTRHTVSGTSIDDIQKVIDQASAGDFIELEAGTYKGSSVLTIANSVCLVGAGMDKTRLQVDLKILVPPNDHSNHMLLVSSLGIDGIVTVAETSYKEIIFQSTEVNCSPERDEDAVSIQCIGKITFDSCEIVGGGDGLSLVGRNTEATIRGTEISYCKSVGIFANPHFTVGPDCAIYSCGGYGIKGRGGWTEVANNHIQPGPWNSFGAPVEDTQNVAVFMG